MEENTLSVLKIAPGQYPQQVEIDNDLKALQQAVGGSIGASYPFEDPVHPKRAAYHQPLCEGNCGAQEPSASPSSRTRQGRKRLARLKN